METSIGCDVVVPMQTLSPTAGNLLPHPSRPPDDSCKDLTSENSISEAQNRLIIQSSQMRVLTDNDMDIVEETPEIKCANETEVSMSID